MTRPQLSPSLVGRLLWTLVGSMTVVALVLAAGGAWLINGVVATTADRLLGASARAIAETLAVEDGEITLDVPASALGMLENNARDNVYYSVRHNNAQVTGYPDLPPAPASKVRIDELTFRYEQYRGATIRIAADTRRLPRQPGVFIVQVAETLEGRRALEIRMLLGLAALEAALVTVAALLVWPAVRWSLNPVIRLREEMDSRTGDHTAFAPLPIHGVPMEMAGVVVGFNALLRRLEIAVDGMRRFTADASHQMRTPLAILRTHLAVLEKRGTEGPAGRQSLRDIKLAVERLQSLLTGLITLARTEEGAPGADLVDVDLQDLCRNIALALAPIATAARIDIHLDAAEQPVHLRTDPFLVTEMLTNLIDNAIRYNRRGGEVALGLSRAGDLVTLWVEDNGPGIAPKDHAEVLRRFHRLPRDQHQSGSGLGLSIVSAIAARLGGTLSLGPGAKGAGLRVEIAFPANS